MSSDGVRSAGELVVTTPAPRGEWRDIVAADPDVLVSQTPQWLDCVRSVGGGADASRLYRAGDGGRFVLPLVRRGPPSLRLSRFESMPAAWGFGGVVASRPPDAGLLRGVLEDLASLGALRIHLRPNPLHAATWEVAAAGRAVRLSRLAHVLDLDGGFEQVWAQRFTAVTRRNVRAAERRGVVAEVGRSPRLVASFYRLLEQSFDRWAEQQSEPRPLARLRGRRRDPIDKFEALTAAMGDACQIWLASYEGRPAAAILVLQGTNAHYTRGAMDKRLAAECHANSLLHKLAIEDACAAGCRAYHMGETGAAQGLARFKARFGAVAHPYAEYRIERLPLTRGEQLLKKTVKRLIGFHDATGVSLPSSSPSGDGQV